jgi:hypothetical protein
MDASSTPAGGDALHELEASVRSALLFSVAIRLAECAILAASSAALTLAAATFSGPSELGRDAFAAAGITALLTAAAWWLEKRPDVESVVRRIDRREGCAGELVTAYEVGRKRGEHTTEIDRTLTRRVSAKLTRGIALRSVAPRSAAILALPLATSAVFLLARESSRERAADLGAPRASSLVDAAAGSLATASQHLRSASARTAASGSPAQARTRELSALADATESVRRDLESSRLSAEKADSTLADPEKRAHELAQEESIDPAARMDAAAAERALIAARAELARAAGRVPLKASDAQSAASSDVPDETSSRSRAHDLGRSASAASQSTATAPSSLSSRSNARGGDAAQSADGDGRSANVAGDPALRDRAGAPNPGPPSSIDSARAADGTETHEHGTTGGRWWPRRYDDVVERWIESRRAPSTDPPRAR